jgi:hypothetical protein
MECRVSWIWIVLLSAVAQYLVSEALCLFDIAARWMIRRSVERLPEDGRVRYRQEWEGELGGIPGSGLLRLLFAVRVRLHVRATARALGATAPRLPLKVQLARVGFMAVASVLWLLTLPATILLAVLIAAIYGRPIFRSRMVRTREGRAVTLRSFNVPSSTTIGRFLDRTDFDALPSLGQMARGRIWPTSGQLGIIVGDLLNGRPTEPFRDSGS